jgi:hypothetical protein
MKPTALIGIALVLAVVLGGLRMATAGQACVSYKVTAPVVGSRSGKPCVHSPFSHPFSVYHCQTIPPVGVAVCATASVDTP